MPNPNFNIAQLASYNEARALRDYINNTQQFVAVGNLILPGDDETAPAPMPNPNFPWLPPSVPRVGIFLPSWSPGPHSDPEPNDGQGRLWLSFRMENGRVFNVGLWIDKFKRYPDSPDYVLRALAAETVA